MISWHSIDSLFVLLLLGSALLDKMIFRLYYNYQPHVVFKTLLAYLHKLRLAGPLLVFIIHFQCVLYCGRHRKLRSKIPQNQGKNIKYKSTQYAHKSPVNINSNRGQIRKLSQTYLCHFSMVAVANSEGGSHEPPLRQNNFIFMDNVLKNK